MLNSLRELMGFILGHGKTKDQIKTAWDTNLKLLRMTQNLLKVEWEKIKKEARS